MSQTNSLNKETVDRDELRVGETKDEEAPRDQQRVAASTTTGKKSRQWEPSANEALKERATRSLIVIPVENIATSREVGLRRGGTGKEGRNSVAYNLLLVDATGQTQ